MLEHFAQGTNRTADIAIYKWILQFAFGGGEVLSFVQASCPSLFDTLKLPGDLPKVVAPPVLECLECGQQLVSNHSCKVRCYSERGVSLVDKVTLHCMNCKLFYNLTQYGNKRDTGFWFYPSPGDLVEATDSACAKRSLLELQCSLV